MRAFLMRNWLVILGIFVGSIAGFLYYYYVGCVTGTCSITSKPFNSTLYGALLGGLGFSILQPSQKKSEK